MNIENLIQVARGEMPADIVLKNGMLVNVFSNEIYKTDVAIYKDKIAGLGEYRGNKEIDLKGAFICPGFIDGHVHIESSMVTIPEYARAVVPRGTTTVVIDPHEIANVLGTEGISYMLKSSKYNPLNVYMMLPSCVPATNLETAGAELNAIDLFPFLTDKWVLGLGEMMNYPGVLFRDESVIDKIKIVTTQGKRLDGHCPALTGKDLSAYISAGIESDHESTTKEEALEKLRLGMYVMIREGSATRDLKALLPIVKPENVNRCFFVTDDRHPQDLIEEGHIDYMIKTAIKEGIEPALAIRMATINGASYFGIKNIGAVSPGYFADIVIVDNFEDFNVRMVFKNGELVAENGKLIYNIPDTQRTNIRGSVNVAWLYEEDFRIRIKPSTKLSSKEISCRVIGTVPGQIVTKHLIEKPLIEDGLIVSDIERDILKVAVIDRHNASGNIGKGFVKGLGLKSGAIASSVAHDSHNIIVAGTNDKDMLTAAVQIIKTQGGIAIVKDGEVIDCLPLPIAGLMSNQSLVEVKNKITQMHSKVKEELGSSVEDPFMLLSFLALPVIPSLKLTDKGLVDVEKFTLVDLFV